jgi:hypothetical protein
MSQSEVMRHSEISALISLSILDFGALGLPAGRETNQFRALEEACYFHLLAPYGHFLWIRRVL